MRAATARRTRRNRASAAIQRVVLLAAGLVFLGFAGCSAGPDPVPRPPLPSASTSAGKPATLPRNAVTLAELGFANGPIASFVVPRTAVIETAVDQPNVVTVVFSSPAAPVLSAFFRDTLFQTGFTIGADDPAQNTLTFAGRGWTGSFTGSGNSSAVVLRPA